MKKFYLSAATIVAALALPGLPAQAQTNEIVIGITITTTGPAAALGIPERNALEFVAKEIGGVPLKVIVLDDGGDPTTATTNARRFVTESKADIIMGSSTTPATIAVSNVANEAGIPHLGLAPFPITPERAKWSVDMPQPVPIMGKVLYEHMKAHNIKTVGYIGYSDSYGDLWFNDFKTQALPMGMALVDEERFARPDTSLAGHSYDAFLVLERVIPVALKKAKPGTPEFREAIREAFLTEHEIAASQGVYNFTEKDRYGLDDRSRIILTVKNGKYVPAE